MTLRDWFVGQADGEGDVARAGRRTEASVSFETVERPTGPRSFAGALWAALMDAHRTSKAVSVDQPQSAVHAMMSRRVRGTRFKVRTKRTSATSCTAWLEEVQ